MFRLATIIKKQRNADMTIVFDLHSFKQFLKAFQNDVDRQYQIIHTIFSSLTSLL